MRWHGATSPVSPAPGRLRVQLPDGRSCRPGHGSLLGLAGSTLDLQRGHRIASLNPGRKRATSLRGRPGWPPGVRASASIRIEAIAGNLGSSQRLDYTVNGASANLARCLEGLTRPLPQFPVLSTGAVLPAPPGQRDVEPQGEHRLEGWPEPMLVYGLRGMR